MNGWRKRLGRSRIPAYPSVFVSHRICTPVYSQRICILLGYIEVCPLCDVFRQCIRKVRIRAYLRYTHLFLRIHTHGAEYDELRIRVFVKKTFEYTTEIRFVSDTPEYMLIFGKMEYVFGADGIQRIWNEYACIRVFVKKSFEYACIRKKKQFFLI